MHYDTLIIGGGPAGSMAASLLARAGWSVALVERSAFPRRKVCGEYLSAANLPLLDDIGIGVAFRAGAGPPVRRVAVFAGHSRLQADLPRSSHGEWGRALSRERLDAILLEHARAAGTAVLQPCKALSISRSRDRFQCIVESMADGTTTELTTRVTIAAHGSWGADSLMLPKRDALPHDLLGFKAHFEHATLETDLMPLLTFPGGYGGMVHCEGERVSLSCCMRRDRLAKLRQSRSGEAGQAVFTHIMEHCRGVREALAHAHRVGGWLSAGPLRPGIRWPERDGVFLVGNIAGEAHPVIAEGISIALQSSHLLCQELISWRRQGASAAELPRLTRKYAALWRRHFGLRVRMSQLVAHWAMRPMLVQGSLPLLNMLPTALTWFAQLSGKGKGGSLKRQRTLAFGA